MTGVESPRGSLGTVPIDVSRGTDREPKCHGLAAKAPRCIRRFTLRALERPWRTSRAPHPDARPRRRDRAALSIEGADTDRHLPSRRPLTASCAPGTGRNGVTRSRRAQRVCRRSVTRSGAQPDESTTGVPPTRFLQVGDVRLTLALSFARQHTVPLPWAGQVRRPNFRTSTTPPAPPALGSTPLASPSRARPRLCSLKRPARQEPPGPCRRAATPLAPRGAPCPDHTLGLVRLRDAHAFHVKHESRRAPTTSHDRPPNLTMRRARDQTTHRVLTRALCRRHWRFWGVPGTQNGHRSSEERCPSIATSVRQVPNAGAQGPRAPSRPESCSGPRPTRTPQ